MLTTELADTVVTNTLIPMMRDYAEDDEQQTEKHLQSLATLEDSSNFTGSNKFTSDCVHVITM